MEIDKSIIDFIESDDTISQIHSFAFLADELYTTIDRWRRHGMMPPNDHTQRLHEYHIQFISVFLQCSQLDHPPLDRLVHLVSEVSAERREVKWCNSHARRGVCVLGRAEKHAQLARSVAEGRPVVRKIVIAARARALC